MLSMSLSWIVGMAFGIEFPPQDLSPEELEEDGPMPFLILHLGILRVYFIKYNIEE